MLRPEPLILIALLTGCGVARDLARPPDMTAPQGEPEHLAMLDPGPAIATMPLPTRAEVAGASLWTGDRGSLLGDNRAMTRGDILTVVIEIDDSAQITNQTDRARQGDQELTIDALFGLPEDAATDGTTLSPAVALGSSSSFSGDGSVRRGEQLELRMAATIVDVLPNGVLSIMGSQEVRVNFELRELLVTGYVRPADISRQNEITYDKIASARISYGGRGQISEMQQPRYGQQVLDIITPF
jgi:flagellar L-ring protein FlgH